MKYNDEILTDENLYDNMNFEYEVVKNKVKLQNVDASVLVRETLFVDFVELLNISNQMKRLAGGKTLIKVNVFIEELQKFSKIMQYSIDEHMCKKELFVKNYCKGVEMIFKSLTNMQRKIVNNNEVSKEDSQTYCRLTANLFTCCCDLFVECKYKDKMS